MSNNDSFVNINLDESINIVRIHNQDLDEQDEEDDIVDENVKDKQNDTEKDEEKNKTVMSAELEQMFHKTFNDFGEYFKIAPTKQARLFFVFIIF